MSNETIIKYVKNKKGQPIGVVLATKTFDNQFSVGWSLCKINGHNADKFDKKFGVQIAAARAKAGYDLKKIPHTIFNHWAEMTHRGAKYFKDCKPKYTA